MKSPASEREAIPNARLGSAVALAVVLAMTISAAVGIAVGVAVLLFPREPDESSSPLQRAGRLVVPIAVGLLVWIVSDLITHWADFTAGFLAGWNGV